MVVGGGGGGGGGPVTTSFEVEVGGGAKGRGKFGCSLFLAV